ncbi:MAG: hypothetical protein IPM69_06770 [Ignavibacteria bacterium]|nr:hypothetical protein [Ignavibacteria bacterium]
MKTTIKISNIFSIISMFMIMPLAVSAQLQSTSYTSPASGIVSSGGALQSQNYNASGNVLWYDPTTIYSSNYTQTGIGNVEILNGKGVTDVKENPLISSQSSIFPNPLREESLLRFYSYSTGKAILEMYDYTGIKIHSESILISSIGYTSVALREFYLKASIGVFMVKLNFGTEAKSMVIMKL